MRRRRGTDVDLIDQHQAGRRSGAALDAVWDELAEFERAELNKLFEFHRAEKFDTTAVHCQVARLVMIDDLRNRLEHKERKGNRAAEKLVTQ